MEEKKQPPYSLYRTAAEGMAESTNAGIYPYLHVLRNRKGILGACMALTLSVAFFANLTQRPVYQSSAELILEPKDSKVISSSQAAGSLMGDPTFLMTQQRLVRGPRLAERVLRKLEQPENRPSFIDCFSIRPSRKRNDPSIFSKKERQALLGAIQRSLSFRQVEGGSRIVAISALGYNPHLLTLLANTAAEAYTQINYESHMDSFRQNFGMISKSLAEIREKIKTGEIASQKINSEIRLLEALHVYGEKHPLVVQLRSEIPELTRKLNHGVQNLETMEISQRKDLRSLLMHASTELEDLQKIESDLYTLKPILEQEVNSNREMYNSIFRKLQEIEVSGGGGGNVWITAEVIEPATVPGKPIRPNKKLNLILGFLIGIFLGMGLAFFLEYLDSSVRSLEDVRSYLKLFPLGMVPRVEFAIKEGTKAENGKKVEETQRAFWLANDSDVPLYVSEAYRIIRTNLAFGSVDTSLKVLQVTSAVKGEGKTTTAANLAISLALTGSRTLIVDADMRRPSLHRIFGWEKLDSGLSDSLTNGKLWESTLIQTATPNLFFLSAGTIPPNPAELLSSKKMKGLIEELRENFDIIIFDSPPVISVADSAILASRVDGTIFVSRAGFIPRHLCLQAKTAIESVNGKIVGCVLNNAQNQHQPYYYHQYYRQYARYGDEVPETGSMEAESTVDLPPTLEKLMALKEPFLVLLSNSWSRIGELLKRERSKKESKSPVGAE